MMVHCSDEIGQQTFESEEFKIIFVHTHECDAACHIVLVIVASKHLVHYNTDRRDGHFLGQGFLVERDETHNLRCVDILCLIRCWKAWPRRRGILYSVWCPHATSISNAILSPIMLHIGRTTGLKVLN